MGGRARVFRRRDAEAQRTHLEFSFALRLNVLASKILTLDCAADRAAAFAWGEASDVALGRRRSERHDDYAIDRLLFASYIGRHFTAHQPGGDDPFDACDRNGRKGKGFSTPKSFDAETRRR